MHEGTIKSIVLERGFGFISSPNQPDAFFHVSDLADDLEWDEQLIERRVRFGIVGMAKGPRAVNIHPAD